MSDNNSGIIEMSFDELYNAVVETKTEQPNSEPVQQTTPEVEDPAPVALDVSSMRTNDTPHVEDILGVFESGIGIDISKNHTGLCLWHDKTVETIGFAVDMDYDKNSYMAEARMRKEFKEKLIQLLGDRHWEVCIIEDVYGGINFDTTRKLLALNCVIDELVLDEKLKIDYIYRFKEAEWMRDMRKIAKFGSKLNPKYECQRILEYLEFDLVMKHQHDRKKDLAEIFYEDRCDATGQLLGLAMRLNIKDRAVKSSSVKLRDLKMYFLEDEDDVMYESDPVLLHNTIINVEFPNKDIEECLLEIANAHPKDVVSILVDTNKLGVFGIKNGFSFYEQGYGYLVFYNKRVLKA